MPSSNLAAYLAKNYLTASTASSSHLGEPPKKKRKKSKHSSTTGLIIADDEDLSLSASNRNGLNEDDNDPDAPMMYEGQTRSAEFRKAKKNAWKTLSEQPESTSSGQAGHNEDNDEADTLLRNAQSEEAKRLAEQEAENAPAIVDLSSSNDPTQPASGVRAGLQTAADTARLIAEEEAREEAERISQRRAKKSTKSKTTLDPSTTQTKKPSAEEETIYRDATGRRIDLSARRAQVQQEAEEKRVAERQEKLSNLGEVQRRELETRKQDLEDAKFLTLGRGVEDEEYNSRLKDQVRWDDPMAGYMAEKRAGGEDGDGDDNGDGAIDRKGRGKNGSAGAGREVVKKKKEYLGPTPPNRYGIKPGWRWDGVDRGNGFEKEWFQARSRRDRNEKLSYEWQMDE